MNLRQRWAQTSVANQALVATSILVAVGTLFYAGAAIVQVWLVNESGKHTDEQIGRIIENVNWMARSMDQSVRDSESNNKQITQNAERSIIAIEDQMRLDERAWVGFSDLSTKYGTGSQVAGSEIINTGRTPARKVEAVIVFSAITDTGEVSALVEHWIKKVMTAARKDTFGRNEYLTNDPQEAGDRGNIMLSYRPDLVPQNVVGGVLHAPMTIRIGTLAPNEEYPLAGVGKPLLENSELTAEFMQSHAIIVFGYISYMDIFDQSRTTTFCNERFAGKADTFGRCHFYNDMK